MDSCTFQFKALNNNKITAAHTAAPQSRNTINGLSAFLMSDEWKTEKDFWDKPWVYPILRFNRWREKGDLLSSTFDMEYEVRLQEDRKRKNFNDLLKLSNADDGLKDEQLLQRYMNHFKKEREI